MGCSASVKFADLKRDSLPEPEAPLPPDPRLPLDPWQKFYLEKSWKTVARNIDKAGMIMFVKAYTGWLLGSRSYIGKLLGSRAYTGKLLGTRSYTGKLLGSRVYTGQLLGSRAYTGQFLDSRAYTGQLLNCRGYIGKSGLNCPTNLGNHIMNADAAESDLFRLLHDYPEVQQKWPQLRHLTDDEVMNSVYLLNLARRIFDTLDHAIDSLGDLDYLIPLLKRLGQMHADMKIMDPEDIWKMERPFLEAVRACLEDRFTYKYEEIYSKFIIFIIETVVIGFDPH
ncbi:hypothetical protein Bbelb_261180 [Branchiostoma belcheri]|nr:hypothetical protein Bbelb_261180 [Branchiostoma belcheri]